VTSRTRGQPDGCDPRRPRYQRGAKRGASLDPSGYDAGKKGRKCHILVDTLGLLLNVVVHPADVQDRDDARLVLDRRTRRLSSNASSPTPIIRRYDRSGQLLTGSLMNYALPRADDLPFDDLPFFVSEFDESQPCTHNPLGAKGCGEAGAIAAPAVLVSAVLDALSPLGIRDIDMPMTPERVWNAI
jgi:hypothetical protein